MPLDLGTAAINDLFVGSSPVSAVYLGSSLAWQRPQSSGGSATFTILTQADDGHQTWTDPFSAAEAFTLWGGESGDRAFYRFANVSIPKGASVTAATWRGTRGWGDSHAYSGALRGVAADNWAAPTTTSGLDTAPLTSASTAVSVAGGGWTENGTVTVDVRAQVQEIVNRTGWAAGNALGIIQVSSAAGWWEIRSMTATLSVTWA